MREFAKKGIIFTFVKVNEMCNDMIKVMQENYDPSGNTMNVTDLSNACATKSQAEVTKDFVNAASFILSAVVGGEKGGKKGAVAKKVKRTGKTLWDPKKFEEKQWFSQTTYFQVKEIAGNKITVENSYGNALYVSKDILEEMYSADHFKKEVPVNMTALAELLHSVQDHIFSVVFRKQPTEENAIDLLEKTDAKTFKDAKKVNQLAKDLIAGQTVKMTCHLI
jgi:hypothetical protein